MANDKGDNFPNDFELKQHQLITSDLKVHVLFPQREIFF